MWVRVEEVCGLAVERGKGEYSVSCSLVLHFKVLPLT